MTTVTMNNTDEETFDVVCGVHELLQMKWA